MTDRDYVDFNIDNILILGCPQPYSFQHQMSLSPDALEFQQKVAKAPISGNIDNPEGGFDALVQVLAMFILFVT